jgi:acetyl-CoA carboxylase carboxyltransferase component
VELIAGFRKVIDVYVAAANDMIDDVTDPRETRPDDPPRARDGRGPES